MPYEVSMSGGSPWGFRLAGGPLAGKPTTVSRITPGGKAAQANVMQGDVLIAVNGSNISHLDLPEAMEMIKISGWTLHLTLISQDEIVHVTKKKRVSETNITTISELERPRSQIVMTPMSERSSRPSSRISAHEKEAQKKEVTEEKDSNNKEELDDGDVSKTEEFTNYEDVESIVRTKSTSKHSAAIRNRYENVPGGLEECYHLHSHMPKLVIKVKGKPNSSHDIKSTKSSWKRKASNSDEATARSETPRPCSADHTPSIHSSSPIPQQPPSPKPRTKIQAENLVENTSVEEKQAEEQPETETEETRETEATNMPDYIRRQLHPPKRLPVYNPKMSWLHDKLKILPKEPNGLSDPGNSLKIAAAAYPCQRIEIEGPLSATIVHSQYNTPVGMYSANQIVSTLVNTAAARGADVPDPEAFGDQHVDVDKSTPVYKMVHASDRSSAAPAQSRSIKILDALLENGREMPRRVM